MSAREFKLNDISTFITSNAYLGGPILIILYYDNPAFSNAATVVSEYQRIQSVYSPQTTNNNLVFARINSGFVQGYTPYKPIFDNEFGIYYNGKSMLPHMDAWQDALLSGTGTGIKTPFEMSIDDVLAMQKADRAVLVSQCQPFLNGGSASVIYSTVTVTVTADAQQTSSGEFVLIFSPSTLIVS
ncbi:hypothetical protein AA313_de0200477 [Arthrobotrys entomopaga]|nr:hypothetical protein AA313_de0200477 [Arthrobotrys entomopaga]